MPEVLLYTRPGCHLCDDAYDVLVQHGFEPQKIDIDPHPELVEQFGNCVPVVVMAGKVRFRGRVNPILLKRLIRSELY